LAKNEDNLIERVTARLDPHYEPFGWHHWPQHPWLSYQFRRGLGETQEGGGSVSEVFQAASRMIPGDKESWHREWLRIAEKNHSRGDSEEGAGHIRTAMNCWLRAADYYRQAEFFLKHDDARRLPTFESMEACSKKFISCLDPPGEAVEVPYAGGVSLCAYFIGSFSKTGDEKRPVLICMGGLDSIKDEMWFMQARGALQRGISVLMVDLPGQGGTLRRHQVVNRHDTEVPIGRCVDWLEKRADVDAKRIAVCGSSLGGYYAARAGCYEPRLAACISHGAIWAVTDLWGDAGEDHGLAEHIKWVFGVPSMRAAMAKAAAFTLQGHLERMKCPYLVLHGAHDVLTVSQARKVYDYAKAKGVDATLRLVSEEETGAEHCQHDNPTMGQELLADWLADTFKIDQRKLVFT
jgi:pimeloyl-ACP methyl ester carboxylesterase